MKTKDIYTLVKTNSREEVKEIIVVTTHYLSRITERYDIEDDKWIYVWIDKAIHEFAKTFQTWRSKIHPGQYNLYFLIDKHKYKHIFQYNNENHKIVLITIYKPWETESDEENNSIQSVL